MGHPSVWENTLKPLLLQSFEGDEQAYREFLTQLSEFLKSAFSHKVPKNHFEDWQQDVLISIHSKKHTYQTDLDLMPWIYSIAQYKLIDYLRSQKSKPLSFLDNVDIAGWDTFGHLKIRQLFNDITQGLSEKQQALLYKLKVEERSLKETAQSLEMTTGACKVAIHRLIKELKPIRLKDSA